MLDTAHQHPRPLSTIDRNDALGDVLREIADALDLVGNPQDPNDLPKVIGYRLTPRNGLDCPFLDVVLHGIDRRIGGDYPPCTTCIASRQRLDRFGNLSLRQAAHLRDCPREFLQVGVEDFGGMRHCVGRSKLRHTTRRTLCIVIRCPCDDGGNELPFHAPQG